MDRSNTTSTTIHRDWFFRTYANKENIGHQLNVGHIVSSYHHPQYPKHFIVAFHQLDKILELLEMETEILVDEQCEPGAYFCHLSEDVPLVTCSPKQYIDKNVGLVPNATSYKVKSMMYSDWDILRANCDKGLSQVSYDLFQF